MKSSNMIRIFTVLMLFTIQIVGNFGVHATFVREGPSRAVSQPWRHISSYSANKIAMLDPDNGWGILNVGTKAFLYHWDGTTWQKHSEITHSQDIVRSDIEMLSETDGWIALGGPLGQDAESSLYHWDGSDWTLFDTLTDPNEISFIALDMISSGDGWGLAAFGFGSYLYHWNGADWSKDKTIWISENFINRDIHMVSSDDGWAIGSSIYRFDGDEWREFDILPSIDYDFYGIDMISADDGWIVGEEGTILHWNGADWTVVPSPTTADLTAVSMASTDHGSAIGGNYGGPSVLIQWDGSSWTQMESPTNVELYDVLMVSEYDGWLTSGWSYTEPSGMFRYNPTSLEMNFTSGDIGSYLNVIGEGFPPNTAATISINDQVISTTISTDESGSIQFTLTTASADAGVYYVTVSVNPESTARFILSADEPMRLPEEEYVLLEVPAGVALQEVYLPLIIK